MAMASQKNSGIKQNGKAFIPDQVVIRTPIPDDAVVSIFNLAEGHEMTTFPIDARRKEKFEAFYNSLRSNKYAIPSGLPVGGNLIAVFDNRSWHPALAPYDVYKNQKTGRAHCNAYVIDSGHYVEDIPVEEGCRLLPRQFLDLIPPWMLEDRTDERVIRLKRDPPPEQEFIDYSVCIPWEDLEPPEFEFRREELLKPELDRKASGEPTSRDVRSAAMDTTTVKIKVTYAFSPSAFFFVLKRHEGILQTLNEKMKAVYSHEITDPYLIPSELVVEKMAVVVSASQSAWYRAYVTQILDEDVCIVQPIDGHKAEEVYKHSLRFIHKSIADIPALGYRGKLVGVLPRSQVWSDAAKAAFSDISSSFNRYIVGLVQFFTVDGIAAMYLWTKDKDHQDCWIGDELVKRFLARHDETPIDKQPNRALPENDAQAALLAECLSVLAIDGSAF